MILAFIDDGIDPSHTKNIDIIDAYTIKRNGLRLSKRRIYNNRISHATICCQYLNTGRNKLKVIDIKIMQNGKANIESLLTALEWCLSKNIKLINLSLGTLDFRDKIALEPIINKLLLKGVFIVAAFHNMFLKSYPAAFPRVFGVRCDLSNTLKFGEIALDIMKGFSISNCFTACIRNNITRISTDINDSKTISNSLAAPILTSHIASYLEEFPNASYNQVMRWLLKEAKQNTGMSQSISNCMKAPLYYTSKSILICLIGFDQKLQKLKKLFINDGFSVEYFTLNNDAVSCEDSIPLSEYFCDNYFCDDIIYTIDNIYESSLKFFELDKSNNVKINSDIFDIVICICGSIISAQAGEKLYYFESVQKLYRFIKNYTYYVKLYT